jgi:hypothetical protein
MPRVGVGKKIERMFTYGTWQSVQDFTSVAVAKERYHAIADAMRNCSPGGTPATLKDMMSDELRQDGYQEYVQWVMPKGHKWEFALTSVLLTRKGSGYQVIFTVLGDAFGKNYRE